MDGVIVIRKEKGFTSHDVVAKLRGILRQKKSLQNRVRPYSVSRN
mgnify:CR=1 FL=1